MSQITFDIAADRLLAHEGGYVNNPNDPGGETNWGISRRAYPDADIANLTRDQAKAIYFRDYWEPLGNIHPAIKFQVFDFAVNSGRETAIRKLQSAVGVADDGVFGPVSKSAVKAMNPLEVLMLYNAERIQFLTSLKVWPQFGKGWARRIAENLNYAAHDVETSAASPADALLNDVVARKIGYEPLPVISPPQPAPEPQPALSMAKRVMVLPSFLNALKAGEEVVNAAKVKNIQGFSSALAALLIAAAAIGRAYGYTLPITDAQLGELVVLAVGFLWNAWATFATSKKVGVGVQPPAGGGNEQTADRSVPGATYDTGWPAGINDGRSG